MGESEEMEFNVNVIAKIIAFCSFVNGINAGGGRQQ
jgi:hypothetical protein